MDSDTDSAEPNENSSADADNEVDRDREVPAEKWIDVHELDDHARFLIGDDK